MSDLNNNWNCSVGGVVLNEDKILLVRHTYGAAKNKFLIPGGYIQNNEMPEQAVIREVLEETGIITKVNSLLGVRFTQKDWYAIFKLDYISGEPTSDNNENDFAVFIDLKEALIRDDVTELTKLIIDSILNNTNSILLNDYFPTSKTRKEYTIYGLK